MSWRYARSTLRLATMVGRLAVVLAGRAGASVLLVSVAMGRPPTPSSHEVLTLGGRWDAVGYAQ